MCILSFIYDSTTWEMWYRYWWQCCWTRTERGAASRLCFFIFFTLIYSFGVIGKLFNRKSQRTADSYWNCDLVQEGVDLNRVIFSYTWCVPCSNHWCRLDPARQRALDQTRSSLTRTVPIWLNASTRSHSTINTCWAFHVWHFFFSCVVEICNGDIVFFC